MGLDIYLEKFTKPTIDTNKTYTSAELYDKSLSYITINDNNIENHFRGHDLDVQDYQPLLDDVLKTLEDNGIDTSKLNIIEEKN